MTIKDIFDTMDYGPAPESAAEALALIKEHGGIAGPFIGGQWGPMRHDFDDINPATGEVLAGVTQCTADEVAKAVAAARKAQPAWAKDPAKRARLLYALARGLQKHSRLFAVVESLDTGKPIREARDIDIPQAQRHFYYHAGLAQMMSEHLPNHEPMGVCGQIVPWNFPLLMLAWKVAPALAMGNTVVLKPAEDTPLTAMFFAELCQNVGLPDGVVNIVTGNGETGAALVDADVDKIAFTGSTATGRALREQTAGTGKALTLELGGKSPYIIFEDADIDSAVEGLVDAIWFNGGQVCCAGSRLLVQEGIAEGVHARIKARMAKLRVGNPLDKCIDVGAIVSQRQLDRITQMVSASGGTVHQADAPQGCYYPPTLITGLTPADPLMQEEIFGPVLVSTTFRTPAEAVQLANNTRYGLAASVWSENVNLSLDIAPKLAAGVVWVNGTNMFDASAPFGGVRESGFGRESGWEGAMAYVRPKGKAKPQPQITANSGSGGAMATVDRTVKLYVGGKQSRPDGGYTAHVYSPKGKLIGEAPLANRKDIRNAVEAAQKANGWAGQTAALRVQILYYLAENLSAQSGAFVDTLTEATGSAAKAKAETDAAIDTLFTWAALADKVEGRVKPVPLRGTALAMRKPTGVVGVLCRDDAPLLGAVQTIAPLLALGNRTVAVLSEAHPLIMGDLTQLLETSDVPGGVVNLLTGNHAELAPTLADHADVDAVWSFSSTDLSTEIERGAAGNLKRTWVTYGTTRDWPTTAYVDAATEVQTVWIPFGE